MLNNILTKSFNHWNFFGSLIEKRICFGEKEENQKTSGSHFKNRDKKLKDF